MLSNVANTNVDYSAAIASGINAGIDGQEEAQAISHPPHAGELLKSLPAAQLHGTGWILDVLEDLLAFSQENDLPASADSLSKAYLQVAKEIGKNTH